MSMMSSKQPHCAQNHRALSASRAELKEVEIAWREEVVAAGEVQIRCLLLLLLLPQSLGRSELMVASNAPACLEAEDVFLAGCRCQSVVHVPQVLAWVR